MHTNNIRAIECTPAKFVDKETVVKIENNIFPSIRSGNINN